jgi:hypothetical protein
MTLAFVGGGRGLGLLPVWRALCAMLRCLGFGV